MRLDMADIQTIRDDIDVDRILLEVALMPAFLRGFGNTDEENVSFHASSPAGGIRRIEYAMESAWGLHVSIVFVKRL